jgi:colanic acid/amylovoran biosynthesis protein
MILELKGAQFANQGAKLMLAAVLARVRARWPDVAVALSTGRFTQASDLANLSALRKLSLRRRGIDVTVLSDRWPRIVDRWLNHRGWVAESGINAVLDLSGFAYGDRWGSESTRRLAAELSRHARRGRPYVLLPQAFGPFSDPGAARVLGRSLQHARLIYARDPVSLGHLAALAPDLGPTLSLSPDLTIGVHGDRGGATRWAVDAETVLFIPNRRMLDSAPATPQWANQYLDLLRLMIDLCLGRRLNVRIVNHAGLEDGALCADLSDPARGVTVIDEQDPLVLKGLIGASRLVISSRYHGCVSALSQGVPCLATSWSHKYQTLFEEFGRGDWVIADPDRSRAIELLEDLLDRERDPSHERIAALEARVETMWADVFRAVAPALERQ